MKPVDKIKTRWDQIKDNEHKSNGEMKKFKENEVLVSIKEELNQFARKGR